MKGENGFLSSAQAKKKPLSSWIAFFSMVGTFLRKLLRRPLYDSRSNNYACTLYLTCVSVYMCTDWFYLLHLSVYRKVYWLSSVMIPQQKCRLLGTKVLCSLLFHRLRVLLILTLTSATACISWVKLSRQRGSLLIAPKGPQASFDLLHKNIPIYYVV